MAIRIWVSSARTVAMNCSISIYRTNQHHRTDLSSCFSEAAYDWPALPTESFTHTATEDSCSSHRKLGDLRLQSFNL
eukprot:2617903-Rhodomonas_salina.5